jgi:hypothetical protein
LNRIYLAKLRGRRRQIATAQRQHVIAQNRPVKPAKIPTIIGVQREGKDGGFISSGSFGKQNSPI